MKSLFLLTALLASPAFADTQTDKIDERIVYIRNGEATTIWMKKTEKPSAVNTTPVPCLEQIVIRIERGVQQTVANPHYAKCLEEQTRVNAQERGGDED